MEAAIPKYVGRRMGSFLMYLALIPSVSVQFKVDTPQEFLVAAVGSDIILPCTVTPMLSATGLEVRWFRDKYENVALLIKDGQEDRQRQIADYRGRAFLLAGPEKGNLSLMLRQVRLSDAGIYHCFVENITTKIYEEGIIKLIVVGLGTPPLVSVTVQGSSVILSCSSDEWFPKPEIFWVDGKRKLLPADKSANNKTSSGLFHVHSHLNLTDASDGILYCGLQHPVTKTETGVYVRVSDNVFPRASPWEIAFWILLIISLGVFALLAWFFYSKQKEKERQLRERDDNAESLKREVEWRKISIIKESILFDPSTAYCGLLVSPDSYTISTTDVVQDVPQNPERFDTEPCVLGQMAFCSGTHYWETEILEKSGEFWSLGIASQSVRRTGGQRECPEALIWAIRGTNEGYYALYTPPKPIDFDPRRQRIQKVGTYLNYDMGKVCFYDVDTYRCLHTFNERFTEPVYPFYYVGPGIAFSLKPLSYESNGRASPPSSVDDD